MIERDRDGFVAHVGARTLRSDTCVPLVDAIAIVLARTPPPASAHASTEAPAIAEWGGGWRGSWLTGIGGVPTVGLGGELAGYVRRHHWYGELAFADWEQGGAMAQMPHAELGLATATVRVGYAPEPKPIRAWLAMDIGRMSGSDGLGTSGWAAIGPGFGVAWPIAPRLRLVGSVELLASLDRARFGMVYDSSPLVARTTLGLEVGWR